MCSASAVAAEVGPVRLRCAAGGSRTRALSQVVAAPRHDDVGPRVGQEGAQRGLVAAHRLLQQRRVEPERRLARSNCSGAGKTLP